MSETMPEGVSRQEFSELATAVGDLRGALDELREASTASERQEAQAGVRDAKADLGAVAKELGIDPKRLEKAAAEAKASDERERLRGILVELLDEELAEPAEEAAGQVADAAEGAVEKVKEQAPEPDTVPTHDHWSDRPISSLFK